MKLQVRPSRGRTGYSVPTWLTWARGRGWRQDPAAHERGLERCHRGPGSWKDERQDPQRSRRGAGQGAALDFLRAASPLGLQPSWVQKLVASLKAGDGERALVWAALIRGGCLGHWSLSWHCRTDKALKAEWQGPGGGCTGTSETLTRGSLPSTPTGSINVPSKDGNSISTVSSEEKVTSSPWEIVFFGFQPGVVQEGLAHRPHEGPGSSQGVLKRPAATRPPRRKPASVLKCSRRAPAPAHSV